MNEHEPTGSAGTSDPIRPPPVPPNTIALGVGVRSAPQPPRPTNWKKVLLIVGLVTVFVLALLALTAALIFGGCMYLIEKAGH